MDELSRSDIRISGRAYREGWIDSEKADEILKMLMFHAASDNARVAISALDELVKIRALDIKEREVALKETVADDKRRIALLTKLASIDPTELAKRARAIGITGG